MTWLVGAYGSDMKGTAEGIVALSSATGGALKVLGLAARAMSPSFLVAHADHVYAVAEGAGGIESFRRGAGFALEADGSAESGGTWPCHISVSDHVLLTSNYFSGELGVVKLDQSGSADRLLAALPGTGAGPHPDQNGPHAHASIVVDDSTVLSLDLGADRIYLHRIARGRLERTGEIALPAGTGPRDIVRHPSGLLYVLGELDGSLHVFEWNGGQLRSVTSVAIPGHEAGDHGAAISFGPQGRHVYTGLRGSHRISVSAVSEDGRWIDQVGWVASGGEWPRHHAVDGIFLHVANERSNSIATFVLKDGGMPELSSTLEVASPTYLLRV